MMICAMLDVTGGKSKKDSSWSSIGRHCRLLSRGAPRAKRSHPKRHLIFLASTSCRFVLVNRSFVFFFDIAIDLARLIRGIAIEAEGVKTGSERMLVFRYVSSETLSKTASISAAMSGRSSLIGNKWGALVDLFTLCNHL